MSSCSSTNTTRHNITANTDLEQEIDKLAEIRDSTRDSGAVLMEPTIIAVKGFKDLCRSL